MYVGDRMYISTKCKDKGNALCPQNKNKWGHKNILNEAFL